MHPSEVPSPAPSIEDVAKRLLNDSNTTVEYVTDAFADIGVPALCVMPTVFRPEVSFSGQFLARALPDLSDLYRGRRVLDLGCGTGLLGLVCAAHGAQSVAFTDLSPSAAANAERNAEIMKLEHWSAVAGSLFEAVDDEQFDVIVFNPPGISGTPSTIVEAAVMSEDTLLASFFAELPAYLRPGGIAIMPTSTRHAAERNPANLAVARGMRVETLAERKHDDGSVQYAVGIRL